MVKEMMSDCRTLKSETIHRHSRVRPASRETLKAEL
jgi:hypothetical protein